MVKAVEYGFNSSRGYDELEQFLHGYFPRYPIVSNAKANFPFQRRVERSEAIASYKWMTFNDAWVNVLIFDIDYPISLRDAYDLCMEKIGLEPTWITETDKGVHIAYALKNMLQYDWEKGINLAKRTKVAISKEFGADEKGSHRLRGYWRNPLEHNFYASLKTYELPDFYPVTKKYQDKKRVRSPQERFTNAIIKQQVKYNTDTFKVGNRNYGTWYSAMQFTNHSQDEETITTIVRELHHQKSKHTPEIALDEQEVYTIARSVYKYNKEGNNNVSHGSYQRRESWKVGIMKLPTMKGLTRKQYLEETARRQSLASTYSAEHKTAKTKKQILDAIHRLKFLRLNLTIRNIAVYSKRSIGTVHRYFTDIDVRGLLACSISSIHVIPESLSTLSVGVELWLSETIGLRVIEKSENELIFEMSRRE